MSIEDEAREATLAHIAKLEARIGVLELALYAPPPDGSASWLATAF